MKSNRTALSEWGCIVSGTVSGLTVIVWMFHIQPSQGWIFPTILAGATLACGILFYLGKRIERHPSPSAGTDAGSITTSDLLTSQHREIAKLRLDQLADDATMLVRLAPTNNAGHETACTLWNMFVSKWRTDVIIALQNNFGNDQVAYFAEADGFNKHEPVGNIADESAASYRELLHCQRNLKNLKHNLK